MGIKKKDLCEISTVRITLYLVIFVLVAVTVFYKRGGGNTTKAPQILVHDLPGPDGVCPRIAEGLYKELAVISAAVYFLLSVKIKPS